MESSALSQNRFTLMIYFLAFIAMLVSVPRFGKKTIDLRSIKKYGVAFGGNVLYLSLLKPLESSALSQNKFTLIIYFLAFIAMLVSVPQFHK